MIEINKKERNMTGPRFGGGKDMWEKCGQRQNGHDPGPREERAWVERGGQGAAARRPKKWQKRQVTHSWMI